MKISTFTVCTWYWPYLMCLKWLCMIIHGTGITCIMESNIAGNGVPSNRHSLAFTPVTDISPTKPTGQRSQSYRVTPERDDTVYGLLRPRSVTPQPNDPETRLVLSQRVWKFSSIVQIQIFWDTVTCLLVFGNVWQMMCNNECYFVYINT